MEYEEVLYQIGDRVTFVRDYDCAREGVVVQIILPVYPSRAVRYVIVARGHQHICYGWQILD
jgi:hypothetical protein